MNKKNRNNKVCDLSSKLKSPLFEEKDNLLSDNQNNVNSPVYKPSPPKEPKHDDFYAEIFTHAKKREFKRFYSELYDFSLPPLIENIENLHKKFLFKDIRPYFEDKNCNDFFKNLIHDYFDTNETFLPLNCLQPSAIWTDINHTPLFGPKIISSDSNKIISGGIDFTIRIWEIDYEKRAFKFISELWGHSKDINVILTDKHWNQIYSASEDTTIRIWSIKSLSQIAILRGHNGGVKSMRLTDDELFLISGALDHTVRVWNIDQKEVFKIFEFTVSMSDIITSRNNFFIAFPDKLQVYDSHSMSHLKDFNEEKIQWLSINSKKNLMVFTQKLSSDDFSITIWDLDGLCALKSYKKKDSRLFNVHMTPDSLKLIFLCGQNIEIWDIADIQKPITSIVTNFNLDYGTTMSEKIGISPDSKNLFVFFQKNGSEYIFMIKIENLEKSAFQPIHTKENDRLNYQNLDFSSNGEYILWNEENKVNIFDFSRNKTQTLELEPIQKEKVVSLLSYQNILIVGNDKCEIKLYNLWNGCLIKTLKEEISFLNKMAILKKSDYKRTNLFLVMNTPQKEIRLLNLTKEIEIDEKYELKEEVTQISISGENESIYIGTKEGIYELKTEDREQLSKLNSVKISDSEAKIYSFKDKVLTLKDGIIKFCKGEAPPKSYQSDNF